MLREGYRTPRRCREVRVRSGLRQVVECASPLSTLATNMMSNKFQGTFGIYEVFGGDDQRVLKKAKSRSAQVHLH